ncbi:hypothetical protein Pcinc_044425 [Petrolisthes cinctipes]|uniref:Uncharacterized protein n=1 Tax=Petrolisthes cinctipes TaxID=88211 RepID=A0AAE1BH50_PETCI|nr:hypothetical protein Pcinc_044425 [Petrolisthes cinctipes]
MPASQVTVVTNNNIQLMPTTPAQMMALAVPTPKPGQVNATWIPVTAAIPITYHQPVCPKPPQCPCRCRGKPFSAIRQASLIVIALFVLVGIICCVITIRLKGGLPWINRPTKTTSLKG